VWPAGEPWPSWEQGVAGEHVGPDEQADPAWGVTWGVK
jgi:hypothetical protein